MCVCEGLQVCAGALRCEQGPSGVCRGLQVRAWALRCVCGGGPLGIHVGPKACMWALRCVQGPSGVCVGAPGCVQGPAGAQQLFLALARVSAPALSSENEAGGG